MSQDELILLCLKIGLIAGFIALGAWVLLYSRLTRRAAWTDPIGQTLIIETLLLAGLFVPSILSLFFHLNRFDSRIVAWLDVALIGLVTPVMLWRCLVFLKIAAGSSAGKSATH
jgi:hypothetical protein